VVIWGYVSGLIPKAPVFGAGISSGRVLQEATHAVETPVIPGTRYHLAPGVHSHNAYLQVWYETGAVGAVILLGLGLIVLRALSGFPAPTQPYLVATFAACALVVATAFAIWAPWFIASLAMTAIFAGLGAALPAVVELLGQEHRSRHPQRHGEEADPYRAVQEFLGLLGDHSPSLPPERSRVWQNPCRL
jgi:O-antigen ligase